MEELLRKLKQRNQRYLLVIGQNNMDKKELHNNIIYALTAADSVIESINILSECGIYIDKTEPFKDVLEKIYEVW